MNVLWNGEVVKSINSTGMAPGVWQQIIVMVDGTGPNNVLGFQGTGQENYARRVHRQCQPGTGHFGR